MKKTFLPLFTILTLALASCGGGGGGGPVASVLGETGARPTGTAIEIASLKPNGESQSKPSPAPSPTQTTQVETNSETEQEESAPEITVAPEPQEEIETASEIPTPPQPEQPAPEPSPEPESVVETSSTSETTEPTTQTVAPPAMQDYFTTLHAQQQSLTTGYVEKHVPYTSELKRPESLPPLLPLPLPNGETPKPVISPTVKFVSTNPRAQSFTVGENGIASFVARNHHIRGESQPASTYQFNINERVAVANEILPEGYSVDDRFHFVLDNSGIRQFGQHIGVQYGYVSFTRMVRYANEDGYAYKESDPVDYSFLQTSVGETPASNLPKQVVNYNGYAYGEFSLPNEDISLANSWSNHGGSHATYRYPTGYFIGNFAMEADFLAGTINAEITQASSGYMLYNSNNNRKVIGTYTGRRDVLNPYGTTFLGEYTASDDIGYRLENFNIYGGFYGPNAEEVSALGAGDYVADDDYIEKWGLSENRGRAIIGLIGQQNNLRDFAADISFLDGLNINRQPQLRFIYDRNGDFNFVSTNTKDVRRINIKAETVRKSNFPSYVVHYDSKNYRFHAIRQLKDNALGNILTVLKRDYPFNGNADINHALALVNTEKLFGDKYSNARFTIMALLSGDNAQNVLARDKNEIFNEGINYKEFSFLYSGENPTANSYNFGNQSVEYRGDTITAYDRSGGSVAQADFNFGEFKMNFNFANNEIAGKVYDVGTNFNENSVQGTFTGNVGIGEYVEPSNSADSRFTLGHVADTHRFYGTYIGNGDSGLEFDVHGKFYGNQAQEIGAIGHGANDETGETGIIGFIGKK